MPNDESIFLSSSATMLSIRKHSQSTPPANVPYNPEGIHTLSTYENSGNWERTV